MKTLIKSIILVVMAAVLVVLIIIPVDLSSAVLKEGMKTKIKGIDTCVCPTTGDCQCLILDFEED